MTSLYNMDLSNNQISGVIPPEIGSLPALNHINLSQNQLSGSIPPELSQLRLFTLNLSNNPISGSIPGSFTSLTNFMSFSFYSTNICEVNSQAFLDWKKTVNTWLSSGKTCTVYHISGSVKSLSGSGIEGAQISSNIWSSAQTSADGSYTLANIPEGTFTLTIAKDGFSFNPLKMEVIVGKRFYPTRTLPGQTLVPWQ